MATADNSQSLYVSLPLILDVPETGEGIGEEGLISIADDLRQYKHLLQAHILSSRGLSFVALEDITYDSIKHVIYLVFEYKSKSQLKLLYHCLKTRENELSDCITNYFMDKSLEIVAGLNLYTKIVCSIWMQKGVYYKCQVDLSEREEETGRESEENLNPANVKANMKGGRLEQAQVTGFVRKAAQEIDKTIHSSSNPKHGYNSAPAHQTSHTEKDGDNTAAVTGSQQSSYPQTDQSSKNQRTETQKQNDDYKDKGNQPGSYPHSETSTKNQTTEATKTTLTGNQHDEHAKTDSTSHDTCTQRKDTSEDVLFSLYYPETRGWKTQQILLEITCFNITVEMKPHCPEIYEATVPLPSNNLKNCTYLYKCYSKGDIFGVMKNEKQSSKYQLRGRRFIKDRWHEAGFKIPDAMMFDEESVRTHLMDIIFHCPDLYGILQTSTMIEDLCTKKLSLPNALRVIQKLEELYKYKKSVSSSLYFVIAIGSLLTNPQHIITNSTVSQITSDVILTDLVNFNTVDLPATSRHNAYKTCLALCMNIYKDKLSVLQYWNRCCLFYDEQFLVSKIQENIDYMRNVRNDNVTREVTLELCQKLFLRQLRNRSELTQTVLESLFRHLPFDIIVFVYGKLKMSNEVLSNEGKLLLETLHSTLLVDVETILQATKRNRDITKLYNIWNTVRGKGIVNENLRKKFSDALISIIEIYPATTTECFPSTLVIKLIEEVLDISDEGVKRNLMKNVMLSANHEVNELFIHLSDNPNMKSQYQLIEEKALECFFQKYAVSNLPFSSKHNQEILNMFGRLLRLSNLKSTCRNAKFQECLSKVIHAALNRYPVSTLLSMIDSFDELREANMSIHDIYIEHLKEVIVKGNERPEDLLQRIPSSTETMMVNTRLAALAVCTLLDSISKTFSGESVFIQFIDIVSQYTVWVRVLHCSGECSHLVKACKIYREVEECILTTLDLFRMYAVPYTLVHKLEKNIRSNQAAKSLLAMFAEKSEIEHFWTDAILKFTEVEKTLSCVKDVLSVVQMRSSILSKEFLELIERIQNTENSLMSGKITANECDEKNIWNKIEELPTLCKNLREVVRSSVFWNVSTEHVQKEVDRRRHSKDASREEDPLCSLSYLFAEMVVGETFVHEMVVEETFAEDKPCLCYLDILQNYGITSYVDAWKKLMNDETCPMDTVLKMFGAAPDVKSEIDIASSVIRCSITKGISGTIERIFMIDEVQSTVEAMESVLNVFNVNWEDETEFSEPLRSFKELLQGQVKDYTFKDVTLALETVFSLDAILSNDTMNIMMALERASTLVAFLKTIVEEDIKNLIDAVEDISEQQVRESTVSSLIEVKQFLYPLLTFPKSGKCTSFLYTLERQTRSSIASSSSLPQKIEDCIQNLHNLKSLYNGVANRGEQTKEIIKNILQKGHFHFYLDESMRVVLFEVSYKQYKIKEVKNQATLVDLRSRALLLMNSERTEMDETRFNKSEFTRFIENVDQCTDIADILFALHSSGHMEYMKVKEQIKPEELFEKRREINIKLETWMQELGNERQAHYLMNFVQGNHIHALYRYLEQNADNKMIIQTLLNFIHPELDAEKLKNSYATERQSCSTLSNKMLLHCVGHSLHTAYCGLKTFHRPVFAESTSLTSIVQSNKLMVVQLDENSQYIVRTVLSLYMNTTRLLPEPFQILFCSRETTWIELELLLQRCLGAKQFYGENTLFCISNVELLPSNIQYKLVESLCQLNKQSHFLLAVLCRGARNHPFISELGECVTSVKPVSDKIVRDIFYFHCSHVLSVTSDQSGLGKTSKIKTQAHENGQAVATLHVSGPMRKTYLIDRLLELEVDQHTALHIDIGSVDETSDLDVFLFELIVLRYVSAGRVSADLKTRFVYIEIANTINDNLRNSLQTAVLFKRMNLQCKGISDLIVSKELNSPIQIVCHYLNALDKGNLDKIDLIFEGNTKHPLSSRQCKTLLQKYIQDISNYSYPTLCSFLGVLADQLKKLSGSTFFRVNRLMDMVGNKVQLTIKSKIVEAIIGASKDFATRSVEFCRESQTSTINIEIDQQYDLAQKLANSTDSMIRWEDSNHLVFVFHNQNINTISALYRHLAKVPADIRTLFEGQMKKSMQDFSKMTQEQLRTMLQKVSRVNPLPLPPEELLELSKSYALTADNLLKMVLIMLRINANIPVIIMGETGCGKTSLIRYLAGICEVDFEVMNIHAGVLEEEIIRRVLHNNTLSENEVQAERWLFLDEINTSESIGLISDIICHHRCLGHELAPNLVVMGACNPYKLRTVQAISTAGLEGKVKTDELSKLVYRVLPLPETMVDYIWDFGVLNEIDEALYIERIVEGVFKKKESHMLFTDLISASQSFVRCNQGSTYSVSLRDVQRCKLLANWFMSILPKKIMLKHSKLSCQDINIKSMILSLAHCYQSRFADKTIRLKYRNVIGNAFKLGGYIFEEGQELFIQNVIKEEQADILNRMRLPPGTAKNTALQENVFVILVCIFNKIPIFVVGKPGCSKSLAMQLIKSNLRGKDSEDKFFKTLPQLYCVSFQGSESSTSDGIIKVFEKAKKYQDSNSVDEVLSVVILDEIGLAEVSRFNPLKVLHSLLEPEGKCQPDVAVVGISNWALDASKMNRAIHLSRPDMDEEELLDTAYSISESFLEKKTKSIFMRSFTNPRLQLGISDIEEELKGMASAYFHYIEELRFRSFHGLRDYYSLIKFTARKFSAMDIAYSEQDKADIIVDGIARNFGGLPEETQTLYDVFQRYIPSIKVKQCSVMKLVTDNILDSIARHLMLITTGESVLGTLTQTLKNIGCERSEIIFGSQFEEDLTDDYNYRILSRIILCMEEGMVLILKDLESIYGSLYDMLNQNYTIIGKKKNCRIALGPYSNPICHVADNFRCIVLTDESMISETDPPFLNRFEKQYLRFFDIVEHQHVLVMNRLEKWVESLTILDGKHLSRNDIFPIYNKDLVASLVLKVEPLVSSDQSADEMTKEIEAICRNELLGIMRPETVIRQKLSKEPMIQKHSEELIQRYFSLPIHDGLENYVLKRLEVAEENSKGMLSIVLTNSNIHAKVPKFIDNKKVQIERLGNFKSEKQLTARIQYFWKINDCNILIIQCCAKNEGKHILLTKLIVEKYRNEQLSKDSETIKHVFLVIHLDRSTNTAESVSHLNFLSEWTLAMVDSIDCPEISLPTFYKMTLTQAVATKRELAQFIIAELPWAYSRMRFGIFGKDVSTILNTINKIESSESMLKIIENKVVSSIQEHTSQIKNRNWQVLVASDVTALKSSSTFTEALDAFIKNTIRGPLAKLLFQLEESNILDSYISFTGQFDRKLVLEKQRIWLQLVGDRRIFSFEQVPDETGPECFTCNAVDLSLKMPFSKYIYDSVEATKDDFMETVQLYRVHCMLDEDEDLPTEVHEEVLLRQENFLLQKLPDLTNFTYGFWQNDYFDDFCKITSQDLFKNRTDKRQSICLRFILERLGIEESPDPFVFVLRLHTSLWIYFSSIRSEMLLIDKCMQTFPTTETEIIEVLTKFKTAPTANKQPLCCNVQEPVAEHDTFDFKVLKTMENHSQDSKDAIMRDVQQVLEIILQEVTQTCELFQINHEPQPILFGNFHEQSNDYIEEMCSTSKTIDETNSIREILVQTVCKHMLPTTACLKQHNGTQKWVDEVNSILSLAASVSRNPDVIYSLRVCSEFCTQLMLPLNLDQDLLEKVGDLIESGYSLDSTCVYDALGLITQTALSNHSHSKQVRDISHRLLASYFVRCLAADPETMSLNALLHLFYESKVPKEYTKFYKVPITMFLQTIEEKLSTYILEGDSEFVKDVNNEVEEQFIEKLDIVISNVLQRGDLEDPLLVLLTDVLQDIFSKQISDRNENENTFDMQSLRSEEVELFYKCHLLIKQNTKGLRFIAATAFCRCFINRAVLLLSSKSFEDFSSRILGILDIVLSDLPGDCNHGLFLFYQKEMLRCRTTAQFEKFCCRHQEQYRFLKLIKLKNRTLVISHDKMHLCLHVTQDIHAASCFLCVDAEDDSFSKTIEELGAKANDLFGMLPLFSFMIREFYLQRAEAVLDDTRRSQADIILNTILSVSKCEEVRTLARCILGIEDFKTNVFMLTETSDHLDINISAFLVSMCSIVLCHGNTHIVENATRRDLPFLLKCLIEPEKIDTLNIPGFKSKQRIDGSGNDVLGLCKCGRRVRFSADHNEFTCRNCNRIFTTVPVMKTSEWDVTYIIWRESGYKLLTTVEVEYLNPITIHILQFLVKGCLLGSLALQYVNEEHLAKAFSIKDPEEILTKSVIGHWTTMQVLLNTDATSLATFLHNILHQTIQQLFVDSSLFEEANSTLVWEQEFDQIVCSLVDCRYEILKQDYKTHIERHRGKLQENDEKLLEIDDNMNITTAEGHHLSLPLYRLRAHPTKLNFCLELYFQKETYPLLELVRLREEELQLPKHIMSLVQWHVAVVANASYVLKRQDCLKMTVQDFIYFKQDSSKKDVMKKRFDAFRKSWEYLKTKSMHTKCSEKMGRIHSESKMSDCLILGENSLPFQLLTSLLKIQNTFLESVLQIADSCASLKFLSNDPSPIPWVQVTELKNESLLECTLDWNTIFQQESTCDLRYGHGKRIHYDFLSIEEIVAKHVVAGKVFIAINNLPKIIFMDELHINYAGLVKQLRINVHQQSLTPDVIAGIKNRQEEDPRTANELITHLGIVMTMMKKLKCSPEQPLVEFVEKWKSGFGRSFPKSLLPSPETCVKLCHIVALSELLEELCADSVKEGLSDVYREKVDGPVKDHLIQLLRNEGLAMVLLKALKRFTYRCLFSQTADPEQSIRIYLSDESFWPVDTYLHNALTIGGSHVDMDDILPDGLMVRHVFDCFDIIQTELEKRRQGTITMSGFATSFQPTAMTRKDIKKKKTMQYRQF